MFSCKTVVFSLLLLNFSLATIIIRSPRNATTSPIINSPINSTDCAPIDSVIEIGLCSQHVYELHLLHNIQVYKDPYGEKVYFGFEENITDICKRINNCFESSNCTDVRRAGIIYKQKCATLDFSYNSMSYCISRFYEAVYENKTDCIKKQNWFSDDVEIKTNAYRNGKQCFLDLANKKCREKEIAYLETRYDDLIYLLTTNTSEAYLPYYFDSIYKNYTSDLHNRDPISSGCHSLYNQLVGRQCEPAVMDLQMKLIKWTKGNGSEETDKKMEADCDKVTSCVSKYCAYDSTYRTWGFGPSCKFSSPANRTHTPVLLPHQQRPDSFDNCYIHIATRANASKYPCVQKYKLLTQYDKKLTDDIFNTISQTYYLSGVLNNKNCVKTLMMKECKRSAVENFDKDYNRIRRDTVAMKRRLRNDTSS